ncbi:g9662 [Coccomyxa elongata]
METESSLAIGVLALALYQQSLGELVYHFTLAMHDAAAVVAMGSRHAHFVWVLHCACHVQILWQVPAQQRTWMC